MEFNVKYGAGDKYIDVTHKFIENNFFDGEKIRISYGTHFNFFFGDPCPGMCKYLNITHGKKKYIISERYPRTTLLNLKEDKKEKEDEIILKQQINIVYYAYIKDINASKKIIFEQLKELKETGILFHAKLYICLTFDNCFSEEYIDEIKEILTDCNVEFSTSFINQFEYPGIKKVWELAHQYPDSLLLYFHSKGMVFSNPTGKRIFHERCLFNHVIKKWKYILKIFEDKNINKAGYMCSKKGLCWFNFWWVKASYFFNLKEPIITTDRYYYEHYLAAGIDKDCYNLYDDTIGLGVEPINVSHMINDHILEIEDDWSPDI